MKSALGAIADVRMGYSFRSRLESNAAGNVAVIQMKDVDESNLLHLDGLVRVLMLDVKERHLVREGDLLFRSRGLTNSAALVSAELGPAVLAAPMLLIRPKANIVDPAYLQWFINHSATQASLAGQAAGTAVKMIGKSVLDNLDVALPSMADQCRIVEMASLAAREALLLEELKRHRKMLLERILMQKAQELC